MGNRHYKHQHSLNAPVYVGWVRSLGTFLQMSNLEGREREEEKKGKHCVLLCVCVSTLCSRRITEQLRNVKYGLQSQTQQSGTTPPLPELHLNPASRSRPSGLSAAHTHPSRVREQTMDISQPHTHTQTLGKDPSDQLCIFKTAFIYLQFDVLVACFFQCFFYFFFI